MNHSPRDIKKYHQAIRSLTSLHVIYRMLPDETKGCIGLYELSNFDEGAIFSFLESKEFDINSAPEDVLQVYYDFEERIEYCEISFTKIKTFSNLLQEESKIDPFSKRLN